ncbi:MAG: hypothetical protein NZ533_07700 [Casimicrobiaceae bacterium]|nr:hypothetical protein [Casimicrobiaceae bacterium]MCX8098978.1 hypothetical protein [Casimicrobiaceae bacterium]MDW8313085.1 hypothetical protein [Burkholderiales bacterium]
MIDTLLTVGLGGTLVAAGAFFWTRRPRYGFGAAALLALVPLAHLLQWLSAPAVTEPHNIARVAAFSVGLLFDLICLAAAVGIAVLAKRERERL